MSEPVATVKRATINVRLLNMILAFTGLALAVAYFLTVNSLSMKGFELRDLKTSHDALLFERQEMESTITALASNQNLNERIAVLKLVPADTIVYVSWDAHIIAQR